MTEQEVRNIIYSNEKLIGLISDFPQTYKTILQQCCFKNATMQFILRKKLNVLLSEGDVFKAIIPGTHFGEALYYSPKKKYNVLIESTRIGRNNIYCYKKSSSSRKFYVVLDEYWILDLFCWIKKNEKKKIFLGNCLMVI
jgi:predicted transcriptional regulator